MDPMERNLRLYPWYQAARNLLFWQSVWFLYFEQLLTAGQAISLAAVYEIATFILEVPSGYFSDRIGRRVTLIISATANILACLLFFSGGGVAALVVGQVLLAVHMSFNSGTDSALLYDSLNAAGRDAEVADAEARASRYSYAALALSAGLGGLLASGLAGNNYALTYLATAAAGAASLAITIAFTEPPAEAETQVRTPLHQLSSVLQRLRDPVLGWMCVFFGALYILSHIPFVFVQPYLRTVLAELDMAAQTPIAIGLVIAAMMATSAVLAWYVVPLRNRFGTKAMFVAALLLQTAIIAAMAWIIHPAIVMLLVLRMVPGTLTRPFVLEAIQPRLASGYRATYLSMQSLLARIAFSGSLFVAAYAVTGTRSLDREALLAILPGFALLGAVITFVLWRTWPQHDDTPPANQSSET